MVIYIFRQILTTVYRLPIAILTILTVAVIAGALLLWLRFLKGRNQSFVSLLALLMSIFFILAVTVLSRDFGSVRELSLMPFASWREYFNGTNLEYLRTNIFNMLLFMPFGASLYALKLPGMSLKKCLLITAAAAFFLSVAVECGQFLLRCGETETDDVINNVIGGLLGASLAWNVCDSYSHLARN